MARWLFRSEAITAQHIREDDKLADSFLYRTPDDHFVIPHWREYLRQRALTVLNPAENQALIARLAGRFVDNVKTTASGIYAAIEQETDYIRPRLSVERSYARQGIAIVGVRETLPFFVAHWGLHQFARRIPELGLDSRVDLRLRAERIETVGALLMHSKRSLSRLVGIGPSVIKDIEKRLDVWAFIDEARGARGGAFTHGTRRDAVAHGIDCGGAVRSLRRRAVREVLRRDRDDLSGRMRWRR